MGDKPEVTQADAFDMGRAWQAMLAGQTLEDSRAVGRTLGADIFAVIQSEIDAAEKELGFDPFTTADLGICAAIKIIHKALARHRASLSDCDAVRELVEALEKLCGAGPVLDAYHHAMPDCECAYCRARAALTRYRGEV